MKRGVAAALTVKPGSSKTVHDFIKDAHDAGVKFLCCSPNLDLFDMKEADLIEVRGDCRRGLPDRGRHGRRLQGADLLMSQLHATRVQHHAGDPLSAEPVLPRAELEAVFADIQADLPMTSNCTAA